MLKKINDNIQCCIKKQKRCKKNYFVKKSQVTTVVHYWHNILYTCELAIYMWNLTPFSAEWNPRNFSRTNVINSNAASATLCPSVRVTYYKTLQMVPLNYHINNNWNSNFLSYTEAIYIINRLISASWNIPAFSFLPMFTIHTDLQKKNEQTLTGMYQQAALSNTIERNQRGINLFPQTQPRIG